MKCTNCQNEIPSDARFCRYCGLATGDASTDKQQRKCDACGTLADQDNQYCIKCGSEIRVQKAAPPAEEKSKKRKPKAKLIAMILLIVVVLSAGTVGGIYAARHNWDVLGVFNNEKNVMPEPQGYISESALSGGEEENNADLKEPKSQDSGDVTTSEPQTPNANGQNPEAQPSRQPSFINANYVLGTWECYVEEFDSTVVFEFSEYGELKMIYEDGTQLVDYTFDPDKMLIEFDIYDEHYGYFTRLWYLFTIGPNKCQMYTTNIEDYNPDGDDMEVVLSPTGLAFNKDEIVVLTRVITQ